MDMSKGHFRGLSKVPSVSSPLSWATSNNKTIMLYHPKCLEKPAKDKYTAEQLKMKTWQSDLEFKKMFG